MLEARRSEMWCHTSWISAMLANIHRDAKKKPAPFKPRDFMPRELVVGDDTDAINGEPTDLAAAFCSGSIAPGNELRASIRRKRERQKSKRENRQ